jgi:hypothetical protein
VEVTCVSSRPARWSLSGSDRLTRDELTEQSHLALIHRLPIVEQPDLEPSVRRAIVAKAWDVSIVDERPRAWYLIVPPDAH